MELRNLLFFVVCIGGGGGDLGYSYDVVDVCVLVRGRRLLLGVDILDVILWC